jgi:peptidoglycan/xylan/chitin deacetylase (PgdA/CDA1 family)
LLPLILLLCLPAQVTRPALQPVESLDTFDLSDHTVVLTMDDGYHTVYENVYPLLKRYGMTATLGLVVGCVGTGTPSYRPKETFLNQAEVREMIDSCHVEIASHTLTHAWLTQLDSTSAWREIADSKKKLESLFGVEVVSLIYPYGSMNSRVAGMARAAGYKLARAVRPGTPDFWVERYRLPEVELRIEVPLARIIRYVRNHRTTIILMHRIVRNPKVFTEWSLADFAALLGWMYTRQVRVVTLSDLYRDWWRDKLAKTLLETTNGPDKREVRLFQDVHVDATSTPHSR